jgi:hypothetical protein
LSALRLCGNAFAAKRIFRLRAAVERNTARCEWLAQKVLACRSGAPMPAAALAPDVTRHDVNWGAEGAPRHKDLAVSDDGSALRLMSDISGFAWAQGAVGVTRGKHFFQVCVLQSKHDEVRIGFVDRDLRVDAEKEWGAGSSHSPASGATFGLLGRFRFGTVPLSDEMRKSVPKVECPCSVGCLLDADAGTMTVFVDGESLEEQCEYKFPTDGREWAPTVALGYKDDALFSNAV